MDHVKYYLYFLEYTAFGTLRLIVNVESTSSEVLFLNMVKMSGDRNAKYLFSSVALWFIKLQFFVGYKFASLIWMMILSKQFLNDWVFSEVQKQQLSGCKFKYTLLNNTYLSWVCRNTPSSDLNAWSVFCSRVFLLIFLFVFFHVYVLCSSCT